MIVFDAVHHAATPSCGSNRLCGSAERLAKARYRVTVNQKIVDLADQWLNLVRLELLVYADNNAAIELYKKYGFQEEGILRRFAFRAGSYADGLLRVRISGE